MNDFRLTFLNTTESVCPQCLRRIPAVRIRKGRDIFLQKTCPDHGTFETIIWREQPPLELWAHTVSHYHSLNETEKTEDNCPFECGLCSRHRQESCCVLIEVTQRCNQHCPFCFANAGNNNIKDPSLGRIRKWFELLMDQGGPFNIQLSGGEPTLRDDLPDIIAAGRSTGFSYFQINTNGLRIAHDRHYLDLLKKAGLSTVFLQFDGTSDSIYHRLRGRSLLKEKKQAIQNCLDYRLGIVLVPTIVPGINSHNIGSIIHFALKQLPYVRGVHFQPVSYFGRYPSPPTNEERITLPEIITAIERQTERLFRADQFAPASCEHPLCSFHGNFTVMPDGSISSWTSQTDNLCSCKTTSPEDTVVRKRNFVARQWGQLVPEKSCYDSHQLINLDGWDNLLNRIQTHSFSISGMAFQDIWNLDLQRLQSCCLHVVNPEGKRIPFCAYNLTDKNGKPLYRHNTTL